MKASSIIAELQRLAAEFGDLEVRVSPGLDEEPLPIEQCFYVEEEDGRMDTYFQIDPVESRKVSSHG